ncbi:hypothetical protein RRF57_003339 [Xylaria bambusicola]|uniref:Uncharacterized protein n=1 Tax=Xylaria bambusicola TaxID=326684 RepID=A0AAN7UEM0_9PEZI
MSTPLDTWVRGQVAPVQGPIHNLPLELALQVADQLDTPEDIINFALACPGFLNYWIHLTEIMQQRRPHLEDPESNPPFQLPPVQAGPIMYDPRRVELFQDYSESTMRRLFSPEIQRLLLLILFMPNPSEKIYDIEFRRNYPQVGQLDPFPLLFQRRTERFNRYYRTIEYGGLLFSFKNMNRISPYSKAINEFATDFVKKALSADPDVAHHTHPSTAHPSLRRSDPLSQRADALRDSSPVQNLSQLHETERERLMLAFYQYEAMCATSCKITGYWEIRYACNIVTNGQRKGIDGWNADRTNQSPLAGQSLCQIERIVCVYNYIRLQYLLMYEALWNEYTELLYAAEAQATAAGIFLYTSKTQATSAAIYNTPGGPLVWVPQMFQDPVKKEEWIDILCSKGCLFLHEVLKMDKDQRREFLVRTWYPTRAKTSASLFAHFLSDSECLVKGIFTQYTNQPALTDDFSYSDAVENAGQQNLAWVLYNNRPNGVRLIDLNWERRNGLRRRGYVFWNCDRLRAMGLDTLDALERLTFLHPDTEFSLLNALDSLRHLGRMVPAHIEDSQTIPDVAWEAAGRLFNTPPDRPLLVEFGVLGETWRIGEHLDARGRPRQPLSIY